MSFLGRSTAEVEMALRERARRCSGCCGVCLAVTMLRAARVAAPDIWAIGIWVLSAHKPTVMVLATGRRLPPGILLEP